MYGSAFVWQIFEHVMCLVGNFDLRGPGSTLQAIAVLAAIVTIHEAGHFVAARSQGIHVSKFSIGFGPALFKFQVSLQTQLTKSMCCVS